MRLLRTSDMLRFSVMLFLALGLVGCAGGSGSDTSLGGVESPVLPPAEEPVPDDPPADDPVPDDPPATPPVYGVRLTWAAPTENSDGSDLEDLAGYRIYDGSQPGTYTEVTDVGNVTEFVVEDLPAGVFYFAVTAYDSVGNESDFSEEVSAALGAAALLASAR